MRIYCRQVRRQEYDKTWNCNNCGRYCNVIYANLAGLITIGLGCAPIYPSIIHSTPFNFGADNSQAVIGIQMAFAYVGTTFMPPLFGLIAQYINIGLFPVYILIFTAIMLLTTEVLNNINKDKAYK